MLARLYIDFSDTMGISNTQGQLTLQSVVKSCKNENQRTNGPVNAHLISGPTVSTKKNQILTSIKGRNSVANLRNTIIYNTNIDLVNDDVYTKFGLIL